jgi:2-oxoisovalerate dehydrogenase E2 component (dihydrolipoyl transacylase)
MSRIKEFNLPDLGEGLTEGEILKWLVSVGDTIELNQPIVEVETAKAAVELPAKWGGQVHKLFHPEGSTVEVGMPIIAIDTDPGAGPIEATGPGTGTDPGSLPTPSAEALAAVELAPDEGAIEPGMIGGPAPGGRTAVLVGYGPRTTAAKLRRAPAHRRPPRRRHRRRRWYRSRPRRPRSPFPRRPGPPGAEVCWPSRRYASSPGTSASTSAP